MDRGTIEKARMDEEARDDARKEGERTGCDYYLQKMV